MDYQFNAIAKFNYPLYSYFFKEVKVDPSLEFYKGGDAFKDPNRKRNVCFLKMTN